MNGCFAMNKEEVLKRFVNKRPTCVGAFGYGSKVFTQLGYEGNEKAQYDIIFIVHDMLLWHRENYRENPKDYSCLGKLFLTTDRIDRVKGHTKMTFQSHIKDEGCTFKYGVIEYFDFLEQLRTWESFFIAGRFQKPVLPMKTNTLLDDAIYYNRKKALYTSLLTLIPAAISLNEVYENLCSLSYNGDFRMGFAENPRKVSNIVLGNLSLFKEIYGIGNKYFEIDREGRVIKNENTLLEDINTLPSSLLEYLESCSCKCQDLQEVRKYILTYLTNMNQLESREQILKGVKTNGIPRSICYTGAKVMKKVKSF